MTRDRDGWLQSKVLMRSIFTNLTGSQSNYLNHIFNEIVLPSLPISLSPSNPSSRVGGATADDREERQRRNGENRAFSRFITLIYGTVISVTKYFKPTQISFLSWLSSVMDISPTLTRPNYKFTLVNRV